MIRTASSSGQARAVHRRSENPTMARSSTSVASGLDHLLKLGTDPFASFRNVAAHTEVPGDENPSWGDGGRTDDDLDRQAVEQELRRYEEDGFSDITSLVAFWEVGMVIP